MREQDDPRTPGWDDIDMDDLRKKRLEEHDPERDVPADWEGGMWA
jgi:hypothetical protein